MSLFPRSMFTSDFPRFPTGEFTPLFRLLDDYASHQQSRTGELSSGLKSFQPKFDVKENKENYELQGELPGIDQKDVQIEFSDANTLVIKGRTERHSESGTPPSALLEGTQDQPKITEAGEQQEQQQQQQQEHYQKPTVEDESITTAETSSGVATPTSSNAVAQANGAHQLQQQLQQQQQQQQQPKKQTSHYWISERSIGEFHRSFSFPARVDHDSVKASLKNGILSIVVPKSQAPTSRRINIE